MVALEDIWSNTDDRIVYTFVVNHDLFDGITVKDVSLVMAMVESLKFVLKQVIFTTFDRKQETTF